MILLSRIIWALTIISAYIQRFIFCRYLATTLFLGEVEVAGIQADPQQPAHAAFLPESRVESCPNTQQSIFWCWRKRLKVQRVHRQ